MAVDDLVNMIAIMAVRQPWVNTSLDSSYCYEMSKTYRQVSNITRTLVGNKIVNHSDVVGASPVGTAPTTSSFST